MRTLVLNAGYEPLAVITFRRALVLVLTGKASVVAEGDDPVVGPQDHGRAAQNILGAARP